MGETVDDLVAFVRAEWAAGYPVHEVRLGVCGSCGGRLFGVQENQDTQAVRRTCRACGAMHHIADSGEYWDDERFGISVCECPPGDEPDWEEFQVAVGYSLYADGLGVRCLAVSSMCTACGRLGHVTDWMSRTGGLDALDQA